MRWSRLVTTAAAALGLPLVLTGCTAGYSGVAAIGFDDTGRLIGAIRVCDKDAGFAMIDRGGMSVAEWERRSAGHGTEFWTLAPSTSPDWSPTPPTPGPRSGSASYQFRVWNVGGAYYSGVPFTLAGLAAVPRGHVLIANDGIGQSSTRVIGLDDLASQPCP